MGLQPQYSNTNFVLAEWALYTSQTPRCKLLAVQEENPEPTELSSFKEYAMQSLEACIRHHKCQSSDDAPMPTRVLESEILDGKYSTKLIETKENDAVAPYVTLSTCWGKALLTTTTTSTLHQRKQNIPWSILSQTFKDAIAVTHLLGYHYLWIDALCIF
ncbi:hypothetical protein LSUE1_G001725 [Lachnellula suecica]|uniref:Heterokaryon incompatibility domain-containing protein n=1 Tax=Lachnellula suecica TaxID=602035 RepID=A0A8T9CDM8_9HELO|nr:hypothetical protein LSUE1_G001725 [Lachnellula suecica]